MYILDVIRSTAICVDVVVVLVDWFTGGVWCGADCTHSAAAVTMFYSACGVVFSVKILVLVHYGVEDRDHLSQQAD